MSTTAGHLLVSDGTEFSNVAMSGDATMTSAGVVTVNGGGMYGQIPSSVSPIPSWSIPGDSFTIDLDGINAAYIPNIPSGNKTYEVVCSNIKYGKTYYFTLQVSRVAGNTLAVNFVTTSGNTNTTYFVNDKRFDDLSNYTTTRTVHIAVQFVQTYTNQITQVTTDTVHVGIFEPDVAHANSYNSRMITSAAAETTIANTDEFVFSDTSADVLKRIDFSDLKNTIFPDDSVTYDKLGPEFTTKATAQTLSSSTTTANADVSAKYSHDITLPGDSTNVTINLNNGKLGHKAILVIYGMGGTGTITFGTTNVYPSSSASFVRVSSDNIDKSSGAINYIEVTVAQVNVYGAPTYIYNVLQQQ